MIADMQPGVFCKCRRNSVFRVGDSMAKRAAQDGHGWTFKMATAERAEARSDTILYSRVFGSTSQHLIAGTN